MEVAASVGVHQTYVSQVERGISRPEPDVLRRLAGTLSVDYTELAALAGYTDALTGEVEIRVTEDEARLVRWLRDVAKTGQYVSPARALAVLRGLYHADDELFADFAGDKDPRPRGADSGPLGA